MPLVVEMNQMTAVHENHAIYDDADTDADACSLSESIIMPNSGFCSNILASMSSNASIFFMALAILG